MDLKKAVKDLQDAMVVMAHLENRHAETIRVHDEMLRSHAAYLVEMTEYRRRIDQNLAEMTDKLDGLIGYVDHQSLAIRQTAAETQELLEYRRQSEEYRWQTERNLAEITEKLNRMAGPPIQPS